MDVRSTWIPRGLGVRLPELDLRTYVTHDGEAGVYFFSLDADGILGVLGARFTHHLPYYYADIDIAVRDDEIRFESDRRHPGLRPARFQGTYGRAARVEVEPGSLAAFLVERYRYYTETPSGEPRCATIGHDPWPLYEAGVTVEENSLFAANGFAHPESAPVHFYSPGVDTLASGSRRV